MNSSHSEDLRPCAWELAMAEWTRTLETLLRTGPPETLVHAVAMLCWYADQEGYDGHTEWARNQIATAIRCALPEDFE